MLDHETAPSHSVTVGIAGHENNENRVECGDVDEAPTALSLDVIEGVNIAETAGSTTALARHRHRSGRRGPAFREHGFTLSDPARFEVEDGVLYLKAGVVLDHETAPSHSVTVGIAGYENNENLRQDFTLNVTDINDTAPVFAGGGAMAVRVDEGTAATGYVAKLKKIDDAATGTLFRLVTGDRAGADTGLFEIDAVSGALSFRSPPDHETPGDADRDNRYEVTVEAVTTDDAGNSRSATQTVTVTVDNINDTAPKFSHEDPPAVGEDVAPGTDAVTRGGGHVVYTAAATPDVAGTTVRYELDRTAGDDSAMFGIDEKSGAVWFVSAPDHEVKTGYSFTVIADAGGLTARQPVTVNITDVNDVPPVIEVPDGGVIEVWENSSGIAHRSRLASKDDAATGIAWALSGTDAAHFSIDSATGAISFISSLDYEDARDADADNRYDLVLSATTTDDMGNSRTDSQAISIRVKDVSPRFVKFQPFAMVPENTTEAFRRFEHMETKGAEVTFSLGGPNANLFAISNAGALAFKTPPDYESRPVEERDQFYVVNVTLTARWDDGRVQSATQTLHVLVTDVPEAPVFTRPANGRAVRRGCGAGNGRRDAG